MSKKGISIQEQWKKWFKPNDEEQRDWVIDYLITKRILPVTGYLTSEKLSETYNNLANTDPVRAELLLLRMKPAWSQKKTRSKNKNRKGYNFVMGTHIQEKLEQLAKASNAPINITLETMIQDNTWFREQLAEVQKNHANNLKRDYESKKDTFEEKLNRQKDLHAVSSKKLTKEIELQNKVIEQLFQDKFRQHLILEESKLVDSQLTEEQEAQVMEHVVKELDNLKKEIKRETRKISSLNALWQADGTSVEH